jgi:hypothetical protein
MPAPAKPVMLDAVTSKVRLNKAVEMKALALISRLLMPGLPSMDSHLRASGRSLERLWT